jgi:hypothetical protein
MTAGSETSTAERQVLLQTNSTRPRRVTQLVNQAVDLNCCKICVPVSFLGYLCIFFICAGVVTKVQFGGVCLQKSSANCV